MDMESLFTHSKWDILTNLSEGPLSPSALAEKTGTTLANISQQLRLLEAAGLVKKERTRSKERSEARIKYSLAQDFGYIIALGSHLATKNKILLDERKSFIIRAWGHEEPTLHPFLEKIFPKIESSLDKLDSLAVISSSKDTIELVILTDEVDEFRTKLNGITLKVKLDSKTIKTHIYNTSEREKRFKTKDAFFMEALKEAFILYGPQGRLKQLQNHGQTN